MDQAPKFPISKCLFFGVFFQYVGWFLKGLRLNEPSITLGGKFTLVAGSVLIFCGIWLYAQGRGWKDRWGVPKTFLFSVGVLCAWFLLTSLVMRLGQLVDLHRRFSMLLLSLTVEICILRWLYRKSPSPAPSSLNLP